MAPPLDRLYSLEQQVLQAVIDYYATPAVVAMLPDGAELPARQYISAGAPAWDCEQLVVHPVRIVGIEGDVGQPVVQAILPHAGHTLRAAEVMVTIARCQPVVRRQGAGKALIPSVDQEEAVAAVVAADAVAVVNALVAAQRAGLLGGCNSVALMDWSSVAAEGGWVGGQHSVLLGLAVG